MARSPRPGPLPVAPIPVFLLTIAGGTIILTAEANEALCPKHRDHSESSIWLTHRKPGDRILRTSGLAAQRIFDSLEVGPG